MVGQDELSYVTGTVEQIDPRGTGDKTYLSYQVDGRRYAVWPNAVPPEISAGFPVGSIVALAFTTTTRQRGEKTQTFRNVTAMDDPSVGDGATYRPPPQGQPSRQSRPAPQPQQRPAAPMFSEHNKQQLIVQQTVLKETLQGWRSMVEYSVLEPPTSLEEAEGQLHEVANMLARIVVNIDFVRQKSAEEEEQFETFKERVKDAGWRQRYILQTIGVSSLDEYFQQNPGASYDDILEVMERAEDELPW